MTTTMHAAPHMFDHALLDARRKIALRRASDDTDFLWQELAQRLVDRLDDVKREFPICVDMGCHHGKLADMLKGRYGIRSLIQMDAAVPALSPGAYRLCARDEYLPFAPGSVDLLVSIGSMQWVNDLPGCLMQIHRALKPDGLFIALIPGGDTLVELRASLDHAMLEITGGISPRISPMLGVKDAADLMQRAGFALPVVDLDRIDMSYSSPLKLMHDLRAMGQTNALVSRSHAPLTRQELALMDGFYRENFAHALGGVRATCEIITLTGWAPHSSQAKPLNRGSGQVSMADIL